MDGDMLFGIVLGSATEFMRRGFFFFWEKLGRQRLGEGLGLGLEGV